MLTISKRKPPTIIWFAFKDHPLLARHPILDCRVLKNPFKYGVPDVVLKQNVTLDPNFSQVVQQGLDMLKESGVVYIGCQFGKHRSGAVIDEIAKTTEVIVQRI